MEVKLLAFAQARDQLGWQERLIECSADETPRRLLARLAPDVSFETWRIALDEEYQSWDTPLGETRELAIIPPVSGG